MKFIKTIYVHEYGGQRVTPFGVISFNHSGVCIINDDELADKVASCSQSLVLADEDEESVKGILENLKASDKKANTPVNPELVGEFLRNADNGAVVESAKVAEAQKTIGTPAGAVDDDGTFTPIVTAEVEPELISTKKEDDSPIVLSKTVTETSPSSPVADMLNEYSQKDIKEMLESSSVDSKIYKDVDDKDALIKIAVDSKII